MMGEGGTEESEKIIVKFRKKPVVIEASQWFKNGDHPNDYTEARIFMENGQFGMKPGSFFKEHEWEGGVVRFFRHPAVDGEKLCQHCRIRMHEHGWIDTFEGGHNVCPGDWIITGVKGERYPCKPDIFATTYEPIETIETEPADRVGGVAHP